MSYDYTHGSEHCSNLREEKLLLKNGGDPQQDNVQTMRDFGAISLNGMSIEPPPT